MSTLQIYPLFKMQWASAVLLAFIYIYPQQSKNTKNSGFIVMQSLPHICFVCNLLCRLLDLSTSTIAEVYPRESWCLRNLPHHDGVKMNCSFIFIHDSLLVSKKSWRWMFLLFSFWKDSFPFGGILLKKMKHQLYGNMGFGVFKQGIKNLKDFCLRINIPKGNYWI